MKTNKWWITGLLLVAAALTAEAQIPAGYKWLNNKEVAFTYDGTYTDSTCFKLTIGKKTSVRTASAPPKNTPSSRYSRKTP